jgi:hypothetical protein
MLLSLTQCMVLAGTLAWRVIMIHGVCTCAANLHDLHIRRCSLACASWLGIPLAEISSRLAARLLLLGCHCDHRCCFLARD